MTKEILRAEINELRDNVLPKLTDEGAKAIIEDYIRLLERKENEAD